MEDSVNKRYASGQEEGGESLSSQEITIASWRRRSGTLISSEQQSTKDSTHIPMTPLSPPDPHDTTTFDSAPASAAIVHCLPDVAAQTGTETKKQRLVRWIQGPRPPARLRVRHYRWWPLAPIEFAWSRLTSPLAYKDVLAPSSRPPISLSGPDVPTCTCSTRCNCEFSSNVSPGQVWWSSVKADARLNRIHWSVLGLVYIGWVLGFAYLVQSLWYQSEVTGLDGVSRSPVFLSCTATYWLRNAGCGLDGQDCAPFYTDADQAGQAFRCPARCDDVTLLNPRSIGAELVNYVPLVVGGGDPDQTYRSDSFICAAAMHAGVLSNSRGGCGSVRLTGAYAGGYQSSRANGLESVGFDAPFPSSYRFEQLESTSDCEDQRWKGYVLNAVMTALVGLVLQPKRIVWFWTLACVGFWHINLISDPRDYPPPIGEAFGDFLPFLFGCYVIYRLAFRFVWPAFVGLPLEATFWTLGFWWVGVLLNVVFAKVPIQRLVARDIAQQPGSLTALIVIVVIVLAIAVYQIVVIRSTGYLPKYLSLYVVGGILIGLAAAVPGETLRIHHYIIALVLLPACAFPTRLSLVYVAFLLGMFTNGVARWGFDGLLQDTTVVQGDATGGTLLPDFNTSAADWATSQGVVRWNPVPQSRSADFDGFNLLVDDVLRYSGAATSFNLSSLAEIFAKQAAVDGQTLEPTFNETVRTAPHYLRLAYTSNGSPGDFTRAATALLNNSTWIAPPDGAT